MPSPFLQVPSSAWLASNELAFAFLDGFPVSDGHTLVVPRRVVPTWFDATRAEQHAILDLVDEVKRLLDGRHAPHGYNVGFNAGAAAGQTVDHLHVHVIPRYEGDVDDPRGGVRFVVPELGNYKRPGHIPRKGASGTTLTTGGREDPFLRRIRPYLDRAERVAIVAAFVQDSGVDVLLPAVREGVSRGATFQLLTGDYLNITAVPALRRLLDELHATEADDDLPGRVEVRIVEHTAIGRAFHPKAWRFEGPGMAIAFVGSSNVSRSALVTGVEWNLGIERGREPEAYARLVEAFASLWDDARDLDEDWLEGYARRARARTAPLPPGEEDDEPLALPPRPREIQREALDALARSREEDRDRGLVVLATGLGKTFLAAFDVEAFHQHTGRWPRVLFLAHRRELLDQARDTFRKVFPDRRFGSFVGANQNLDADVVFASVLKLARPSWLAQLPPDAFGYVIVDEVHHAAAESYRRILAHLEPRFLLGLTATPDRADEADVVGLFDDHVPFRADLAEGIARDLLAPFHYRGLKDPTDYAPIPWRNGRFVTEALTEHVATQARMERLDAELASVPGTRTLVFCVSIRHAEFVRDWLVARGRAAVAVHSGDGSDNRDESLDLLASGDLEFVCTVDLFNEGIDVPAIDRVLMLRPTESPVVFLQQLGRGLRVTAGKDALQVIDFVGNHRVFLHRVRTLLSLGEKTTSLRAFLEEHEEPVLPPGCLVDIELEAIDLLARLLPRNDKSEVVRVYRELRDTRGVRPVPGELFRLGLNPSTAAKGDGWFQFVADEGDLDDAEERALDAGRDWLRDLERTAMSKSFKMVVLEVLLEQDAMFDGIDLDELARRSHRILARSPELFRDLHGVKALPDPRAPEPAAWRRYWDENPVKAWAGSRWFTKEGDRLRPRLQVPAEPATRDALVEMTRQIVDWRLASYRRRQAEDTGGSAFTAKVSRNKRDPILFLPTGAARETVPHGETDVRLPDGRPWRFRFAKVAVNVAHPVGTARNELPDLLRRWFGPNAGQPGTEQRVRFRRAPEGWWVEPLGEVIALPSRGEVIAFPSLRAAAGAASGASTEHEAARVRLPFEAAEEHFAVRASGDSMDGGNRPIRDGDWVILRWARGMGLGAVEGRVALVARGDADVGSAYQLKRVIRESERFVLRSDNPDVPPMEAGDAQVIARVEQVVRPEELGPPEHGVLTLDELAEAFGLTGPPGPGVSRVDGHLFMVVDRPGQLVAPDRVGIVVPDRQPGETAFVLARDGERWTYLGVGRWKDGGWSIPDVAFETWRAFGSGRSASRRLEPEWVEKAERFVDELVARIGPGGWVDGRGKRCRLVEKAPRGGIRVDGGEEGFEARTVSLTDLAWVLKAREEANRRGAALDEGLVNRMRYLDGTPKGSTRWVDTGWAVVVTNPANGR